MKKCSQPKQEVKVDLYLRPALEQQALAGDLVIRSWKQTHANHTLSASLESDQHTKQNCMSHVVLEVTVERSYPSATGKLLCVLLKPGDGELLTYVISGQGEHCSRRTLTVSGDYFVQFFSFQCDVSSLLSCYVTAQPKQKLKDAPKHPGKPQCFGLPDSQSFIHTNQF